MEHTETSSLTPAHQKDKTHPSNTLAPTDDNEGRRLGGQTLSWLSSPNPRTSLQDGNYFRRVGALTLTWY